MEEDGTSDPATAAWVQEVAERDYGGNFGRAAAALLEAAHERARHPEDPWAEAVALQRSRSGRATG